MTTDRILLSHGGGGLRAHELIRDILLPVLRNPILERLDDAACLTVPGVDLALTTDSYVVDPIFFPGGDIGRLAACGTINDLAMQGAEPLCMTLALVLEEGLPLADLKRVLGSFAEVLNETGVHVVTGDTKVVERGKGSGIYINTAGLGIRRHVGCGSAASARPGDVVLVTGTMGDHGMAVLSRREGLCFEAEVASDAAPLWPTVRALLESVPEVHAMRDPTRGGLTAALCDIAQASGVALRIRESAVPVKPAVRSACELLGLDPLNVANEGKAVIVLPQRRAARALETLRAQPLGRDAVVIGEAVDSPAGAVIMRTAIGGQRLLTPPAGEELPRIC